MLLQAVNFTSYGLIRRTLGIHCSKFNFVEIKYMVVRFKSRIFQKTGIHCTSVCVLAVSVNIITRG